MSADINPYETMVYDLKTQLVGREIIYYARLASTMDAARREAKAGAEEGTVIIAGEQTEGRGRVQHAWLSPPGNLALSVILRPPVSGLPYLVMLASLAAVGGIAAVTGLEARIKWPNDILINGKKVGGILIENEVKGGEVLAIIGIGLNVGVKPEDIPDATSLDDELDRRVSCPEVVRALLIEMDRLYVSLPDGGEAIFQGWRERLVTLGKAVSVTSGDAIIKGTAEAVEPSGALLLRLADGSVTHIVAGDITLRHA